jgi:hypothetical protein
VTNGREVQPQTDDPISACNDLRAVNDPQSRRRRSVVSSVLRNDGPTTDDAAMQRPVQFGLVQLLWGTALIGMCIVIIRFVFDPDPPRVSDPAWPVLFFAMPPIGSGFVGLFRNNTKGMLIGMAKGLAVSVAVAMIWILFILPGVES